MVGAIPMRKFAHDTMIDGRVYRISFIALEPTAEEFCAIRLAYRDEKKGDVSYDCRRIIRQAVMPDSEVVTQDFVECECPDSQYRRHQCKHLKALIARGYFDYSTRVEPTTGDK